MNTLLQRSLTIASKIFLWGLAIVLAPISIPYLLIRYFLKRTPDLSRGWHALGGTAIAFGWLFALSSISSGSTLPPSPSAPPQPIAVQQEQPATPPIATTSATTSTIVETPVATTAPIQDISPNGQTTTPSQPSPREETTSYSVVRVIDGDTVDILYNGETERIRLIGVDTPETVDPRKPVQCFGKEASAKLASLLAGKQVILEIDATQGERDTYGRMLAYLFLPDGTHLNLALLEQGYAHEYTYRTPYKYQSAFKAAASQARSSKLGLWADATCAGDTTKAAAAPTPQAPAPKPTPIPVPTPQPELTPVTPASKPTPTPTTQTQGVVKKSNNNICHAPGGAYYERTIYFTPYATMEDCVKSGARPSKR